MGVCIAVAAEAMGEDHGRPSLIRNMLGLEDGRIFVDGYRGIVDMAWKKPAKGKLLARTNMQGEWETRRTREAQT